MRVEGGEETLAACGQAWHGSRWRAAAVARRGVESRGCCWRGRGAAEWAVVVVKRDAARADPHGPSSHASAQPQRRRGVLVRASGAREADLLPGEALLPDLRTPRPVVARSSSNAR